MRFFRGRVPGHKEPHPVEYIIFVYVEEDLAYFRRQAPAMHSGANSARYRSGKIAHSKLHEGRQ